MSIVANNGYPLISVGTGDTVLLDRITTTEYVIEGVQNLTISNPTGGAITLTIWESPDLTSGSGTQILSQSIAMGATEIISAIVGHGYRASNLVAQGSVAGLVAKITTTGSTS